MVALEQAGFAYDRFDRDQIEYLLSEAHASSLVAELDGRVCGSAIMLWRERSPAARLYSIVTDPAVQRRGLGGALLGACEAAAVKRGCRRMLLEVRPDNRTAIDFYLRRGYEEQGMYRRFYEDGSDALRMNKTLVSAPPDRLRLKVPYYAQTLGFTCGPACLMMAMRHFTPSMKLDRALELALWKEATTVFMSRGLGGCDGFGLAVAAQRRGYRASVVVSGNKTPFLSTVRSPVKKEVIRLVHEQLKQEARSLGVKTSYYNVGLEDIVAALRDGLVPIVLVSAYRLLEIKAPHWVVVTGFDGSNVYLHDPFEKDYLEEGGNPRHRAFPIAVFRRISRYGVSGERSAVFVGPPGGSRNGASA